MKKVVSFFLSLAMVFCMSATAFADSSEQTIKYLPSDIEEITEEVIEEYGIVNIDEAGNEIITIPLGPSNDGTYIPAPDCNFDDEMQIISDGVALPQHFSLTPHTHEVIDLSSFNLKTYVPATEYADQGFTITKELNRTVEINASLELNGGITKSAVEASLGVTVGGSYTRGASESYSVTVPNGYKGRIVYNYTCTVYLFTDKTTYVWPNTIPQLITYEYDSCSAYGAPRDGYFGLQVIAR